jgi:hypothetical protein
MLSVVKKSNVNIPFLAAGSFQVLKYKSIEDKGIYHMIKIRVNENAFYHFRKKRNFVNFNEISQRSS